MSASHRYSKSDPPVVAAVIVTLAHLLLNLDGIAFHGSEERETPSATMKLCYETRGADVALVLENTNNVGTQA